MEPEKKRGRKKKETDLVLEPVEKRKGVVRRNGKLLTIKAFLMTRIL